MLSSSEQVFQRFVPIEAVPYCNTLYNNLGFEFKVKKSRQTKLGDYRYDRKTGKHTITINNDLNPYSFLITYLHEVAHLVTFNEHGHRVQPHGVEWKDNFIKTLQPTLNETTFPKEVLNILKKHLNSPKASSCSDPVLYQILKKYDLNSDDIFLHEVPKGATFLFNEKAYIKQETRRTRVLCTEKATGKKYLISKVAAVKMEAPE